MSDDAARKAAEDITWDEAFRIIWGRKTEPQEVARAITGCLTVLQGAGYTEEEVYMLTPLQGLAAYQAFLFGQGDGPSSDTMTKMAFREAELLPDTTG